MTSAAGRVMLEPYRVIDLTNERGLLCGQILGDLGADVIQLEPPGGSSARRIGPFARDEPHPERSLFWWSFTRNKRSVTLDIARAQGIEILHRLLETADFLIDSEMPEDLERLGLSPSVVAARHPRLVHVSITPFGQTGPKASWAASDLVLMAASGTLVLTGDAGLPPLRISVPQAYLHAAGDAAGAALIANHERARSGRGQHVDVSAQQSATIATQSAILASPVGWPDLTRMAGGLKMGPLDLRLIFPASDGFVAITLVFGAGIGPSTGRLMEVVCEHGFCDEATRDKDWIGYAGLLLSGAEPLSEFDRVKDVVAAFTASKTKAELFRMALSKALLIAPIAEMNEVVDLPHFRERGYWEELSHPQLAGTRYIAPGPFARFSKTEVGTRRRPPLLGEHSDEVLGGELGLSESELARLREEGIVR